MEKKKWDYDACFAAALSCKTKQEFIAMGAPYVISHKNGWHKDYTWLISKRIEDGFYDIFDNCFNEAKKYKSISEFQHKAPTAYRKASSNGWLDLWFQRKKKSNGFWDSYENCYEEAKKYKSRTEFRGQNHWAYKSASENGWLDDYTWFEQKKHLAGYWTKENCYKEAQKFESRSEFNESSPGAYYSARINGWLNDYTWFHKPVHDKDTYCVYKYEDRETNSIYIGLTFHLKQRHSEHKTGKIKDGERKFDVVANFFYSLGKNLPDPLIIKDGLTAEEAQYYEEYYLNEYKSLGWNVLNLIKAGSLGGTIAIWTKERCWEEAKKYGSRNELAKSNPAAYSSAWKNGWLVDYSWFVRPDNPLKKWDYNTCLEEAKKYKTRGDFNVGCGSAYKVAWSNNWLDDYTWFEDGRAAYWTKTRCYEEAKKYKTRTEFYKNSGGAYVMARKNGWLNEYTWLNNRNKKNKGYWNFETCFKEAKKFKTLKDFKSKCGRAYELARKNGWIEEYTWLEKLNGFHNREKCYEEAKKYKTRTELQKKASGVYHAALKNGWLDEYTWLESPNKPNGYWNRENCYNEAKKYKSRQEFCKNAKGAYNSACKNGWLVDYTWFSASQSAPKWNRDTCYAEAQKYNSVKEFSKNSGRAYQIALKNKWLDSYSWLEKSHRPKGYWTRDNCYDEAKKYESRSDLAKNNMSVYNVARKNGWLTDYTWFKELKKRT